MPTAYSYIRFSTLEQKKGDSLRRQHDLSEAFAERNGLTIDRSLNLHDLGVSAYGGKNREEGRLGAFLKAVDEGRVAPGSFLLVESLDRLSREEVLDAMGQFTSILKRDITIVTLADGAVYSHATVNANPTNLMMSLLVMTRAHEESLTKSLRVKAAWEAKRKNICVKKLTAQCPRWMRLNAEKTEFQLIPERVEVVLSIIRSAKEGMGQAQIAKRLNEQSVPGFSRQDSLWQPSYVCKILTSPALFGQMRPNLSNKGQLTPIGSVVDGYYAAIMSEAEFHVLQGIRAKRKVGGAKARKGTTMPNLFSGLVKCAYCGSSMVLATAPGPRKTSSETSRANRVPTKYLVCDGARRGNGCYAVQWNYNAFETSFLEYCKGVDFRGLLEQISGTDVRRAKRQVLNDQHQLVVGERAAKKKAIENLLRLVEMGNSSPSLAVYGRMQELETDIGEIEDQVRRLEQELHFLDRQASPEDELNQFRDFAEKMGTLTEDQLFRIRIAMAEQIKHIIRKIDVHPAGRLVDEKTAEFVKHGLLEMGYSEDRMNTALAIHARTKPKRQGRGVRGRYESVADTDRIFVIYTHNDQMRIVRPAFNDPLGLVIAHDWVDIGSREHLQSVKSDF